MSNGSNLASTVCILELNLADALQQVYDTKKMLGKPLKVVAPRAGGLCEGIFNALEQRTGNKIIDRVGMYGRHSLSLFAREKKIVFDRSLQGRHVFVVLDYALPDPAKISPEYHLLACLASTDMYVSLAQQAGQAAKKNGAASVHLFMPNFAYARQDKAHGERGPISAAITARNLEPYYNSITSAHLHAPAIQGMFRDIPLNEISPTEIYTPGFIYRDPETHAPIAPEELTLDGVNTLFSQYCIVSPDAGGVSNARNYAKYLKKFAATLLNVEEDYFVDIPLAQIDKRRSGPGQNEVMNVLGAENVDGRRALIVDDMGDSFGTATKAAEAFHEAGATAVEFIGTHGYFSGNAVERIENSPISRVTVTNSMALPPAITENKDINIIDISPIYAQAIIGMATGPETNLEVEHRYLNDNDGQRETLGGFVMTMMPSKQILPTAQNG